MNRWFHKFFNEHKGVRRLILLWVVLLISYATFQIFQPEAIKGMTGGAAAAYATVVGLATTAIALYKWNRGKDDAKDSDG